MLQDTGISVLTDARYPDWMADRPYRNAFDLSVLHMKPQMIKARLADSSKVHNCSCSPLANHHLTSFASRATRRQARLMPLLELGMSTSFGASFDSSNSGVVRPCAASAPARPMPVPVPVRASKHVSPAVLPSRFTVC